MNKTSEITILKREQKPNLAYAYTPARQDGQDLPIVMFCGGYRSDMEGTKAKFIERQCEQRAQAYIRFDYAGHGASDGAFDDGTIGSWAGDAIDIFDHIANLSNGKKFIIVGSSMGGWIALLLAKVRAESIKGLIGIAAAPDFSETIFENLSKAQQNEMIENGFVKVENDYSEVPYHYSHTFYEEAKTHLLLTKPQTANFPIRLIQGMKDKDVPWETAVKIQKTYSGGDFDIVFVEDGDHRLSRTEDLELIDREILALSES